TATIAEAPPLAIIRLRGHERFGLWPLLRAILRQYPRRAVLGLVLMAAQAFFYNAIFFTYALVLGRFYGVPAGAVGRYIFAFAIGNFFGPLLLGRFFDSLGRKPMMVATYGLAGVLMIATAILFGRDLLDATQLTAAWTAIFFFASAAASSAYLVVTESFPVEVRALSIALFYALGTGIGGVGAPWLFGVLIGTGEPAAIASGYALGAFLMLVAAAFASRLGIAAERKSLEEVARPLSCID
ncbi:MAG TPA: MFS transporter, partial [Casimicrobiaceae bacterium]